MAEGLGPKFFLNIVYNVKKIVSEHFLSYCEVAWKNVALNLFHANVPFLCLLIISENLTKRSYILKFATFSYRFV